MVLRSAGAVAKGFSRELKQTSAAIFATRCARDRALKSRYEVDLRVLEWHAKKMPGVENNN